jgi:hypothetical protein
MAKQYDFAGVEVPLYQWWESRGFFKPIEEVGGREGGKEGGREGGIYKAGGDAIGLPVTTLRCLYPSLPPSLPPRSLGLGFRVETVLNPSPLPALPPSLSPSLPPSLQAHNPRKKKPFVIPMPPPNVTGYLHMGHAMFVAVVVGVGGRVGGREGGEGRGRRVQVGHAHPQVSCFFVLTSSFRPPPSLLPLPPSLPPSLHPSSRTS